MMRRDYLKSALIITLSLLSGSLSSPARAEVFPWTPIQREDIQVVSDSKIEQVVRNELVRKARHTIDIVIYDQGKDVAVGLPFMKELREAADRGVKVRFLTSWFAQFAKDPHRIAPRYLTEPQPATPVDYLIFGGPVAIEAGWALPDGFHEKLLVVDGAEADGVAMTTGRGYSDRYLNWVDTAYLIKGALVDQAREAYEHIWSIARREHGLYKPSHLFSRNRVAVPAFTPDDRQTRLDSGEKARAEDLVEWLQHVTPAGAGTPARAHILHHDLLLQLRGFGKRPAHWGRKERIAKLNDPIIDAMVARSAGAYEIRFNTLSTIVHPKLKAALFAALDRHVPVEIFTNGKEANKVVVPIPLPWPVGLPDMDDLLARGASIFCFEKREPLPYIYVHRKLAIVDDAVIFGSHNLNLPSTLWNDELSFEVESAELADELRQIHEASVAANGRAMDPAAVHQERKHTWLSRWFSRAFMGFF